MGTQETMICRLCLKICDSFKVIEGNIKGFLDVILPKIDLSVTQQSVMCTKCAKQLMISYDFKAQCIYTRDCLLPFANKDTVKLDLKDLYLIKNENSASIPEDENICGFCMSPIKICSAISLDVEDRDGILTNMVEQCVPDLDMSSIKTPIICAPCHGSLENYFHFVKNCLIIEENIKKYYKSLDINSKDQIELSSLLEFTIKNVTTNEVDGNLFGKIKMENKEGSDKLDAIKMEEMFCEENKIKMENHIEMEDQKFLLKEEIEIKTDESDFNRFDEGSILPQPEVTTKLCKEQKCTMRNLEGDLLKPHIKRKLSIVKCDYCSYQTTSGSYLNKHLLTHKDPSEAKMYKCDVCSYETKYNKNLKTHLLKHKDLSELTVYKCDTCSYQTVYKRLLKRHLQKHKHTWEVTMYKCDICSFQTKHKRNLKTHVVLHKSPSELTMYKCNSCPYQTKIKGSLKHHSLRHKDPSEVTMYKCDTCSYQTKYKLNLKRHLVVHKSPSEVTMYKCNSCSYQTKFHGCLKRHLLMHRDPSEVTMHKCDCCSITQEF